MLQKLVQIACTKKHAKKHPVFENMQKTVFF